jgi:hypothetical protein
MPQGPKPPSFVIPTNEIGLVMYVDREAVGIQFVDPNGDQVFVSISGQVLPQLAKSISELTTKMPAVLNWRPAMP